MARLHEKVSNQRKDFLHKLSRQIADTYDAVIIEDLNVRGMAQGLNLAEFTSDNSFGIFRAYLSYRLAEQGKQLIIIDKWYPSSKLCNYCGHKNSGLSLGDRIWTCQQCGKALDRNVNPINIKDEGCRKLGLA